MISVVRARNTEIRVEDFVDYITLMYSFGGE